MGWGQKLEDGVKAGWERLVEVVTWRRGRESLLFVLASQGVFASLALLCSQPAQENLLLSVATGLILAEVISLFVVTSTTSSTGEGTSRLLWPAREIWKLLSQRTAEVMILAGACLAYSFLLEGETLWALGSAYSGAAIALAALPWRSHQMSAKIADGGKRVGRRFQRRVLRPTGRFLAWCLRIAKYWLFFEWLPPLCRAIRDTILGIYHWTLDTLVFPTIRLLKAVWAGILYVVLLRWVPPLLRYIRDFILGWLHWANVEIIQPIWRLVKRIWAAFTYIFLLKWLPPLLAYLNRNIVQPIVKAAIWTKDSAVWVITGGWIPLLLQWIREVKERGVEKVYETLENFKAALRRGRDAALAYAKQSILRFRAWTWRCVVKSGEWIRDEIWRPFLNWLKESGRRIRRWWMEDVVRPAWRTFLLCLSTLTLFLYDELLCPALFHLQVAAKRSRHYALVQWIQPAWAWLYEQLPDRSLFVDDSDTELAGLLPDSTAPASRATPDHLSRQHSEDEEEMAYREGMYIPDVVPDSDSSDEEFSLRQVIRRRPAKPNSSAPSKAANPTSLPAPKAATASSNSADDFLLLHAPIPDIDDV